MKLRFLSLWLLLALAAAAAAAPPPEALAPWVGWALRDHPDHGCLRLAGDPARRQCLWPGVLEIELLADGARFRQRGESQAPDQWLALPGERARWPRALTLDGRPAAVIERDGRPGLWVGQGPYEVSGAWHWDQPPPALALPPAVALVSLRRGGEFLPAVVDGENRLWLGPRRGADPAADSLQIEVFRRLDDGVPVRLRTELRLAVSGVARELSVGRALPEHSVPLELASPLPARLEADGRLRLQVRPGRWRLVLESRYLDRPERFAMAAVDGPWPGQEIWAFRAAPELRGLRLEGAPALDPARLDLPPELAGLPVYLVTPEQPLVAVEEYRGDARPAADRLQLQRSLWLDFDGRGATVRDLISGELSRSGRLQARPELALGRVAVDGEPQVITRLPGVAGAGVELRARELRVEAVGRLGSLAGPAAIGWAGDFDRVGVELHLPPGWQLWHAAGPEVVETSWLASWDLWDLFLCLLIAGATLRLLGWRWGLVAALALALSYHERNAPVAGWVALVAAIPLLGALPAGRLRSRLRALALAALLVLTLSVLGFAVQQVRVALYPQLEQPGAIQPREPGAPAPHFATQALDTAVPAERAAKSAPAVPPPPRYVPDENAQTGPGEPAWRWRQVRLGWQGPVAGGETLALWLSPPWLTRTLKVLQVVLIGLLLFGLGRALWRGGRGDPAGGGPPGARGVAALALVLPALAATGLATPARAGFPPPELLEQLRAELLRPPACEPHCQSLTEAHLAVGSAGDFTLRLRVASAAALGVALPPPQGWQAAALLVDGTPAPLAQLEGTPWAPLQPGVRELVLYGRVGGDSADFRFPLPPMAIGVSAPGWKVEGLEDDRLRGDTLGLRREVATAGERLLPEPVPPFVQIERRLELDLDWRLTTRVTRVAPAQGAIHLEVPLLPGEAVLGEQRLTAEGRMPVALGAGQRQFSWQSRLPPVERLRLVAPEVPHWVELWRVEAAPRWHLASAGLAPVKAPGSAHPEWRPWPGEELTLEVQRPQPVPGASVTVEGAEVVQKVGRRGADLHLELALRSSLGGTYRVALPVPGTLQRVEIDGVEQTRPERDGEVVLPLRPGLQQARIEWRLEQGVAAWTATAPLALPTPAANIDLGLQLPADRWPLWLRGPDLGPAMLYWGVLAVVVAVALALGCAVRRLGLSIPLAAWQWLLLGIGMSTVNSAGSLAVVAWFFALEARRRWTPPARPLVYNLAQAGLILLSLIAVASLVYTIPRSLLAAPDMQVVGNGSSHLDYRWYQDRATGALPTGAVFSLPLWSYRLAMLAWSLWLVFALLRWARWGWACLSAGGLWRRRARSAGADPA